MANVLILGGGFAGVVAAESLAKRIGREHRITLVSRNHHFLFYPALVRLAFGKCEPDDISYDLRESMLDRRIGFIEAEVARIDPENRRVVLAHGELQGDLSYDYLLFALGRRLASEEVIGFFEHAHHLLDLASALKFGEAARGFHEGRAIIGQCPGARLPVPVYETAFALARLLEERGETGKARITLVSPEPASFQFGDKNVALALRDTLEAHAIELLPEFPIGRVSATVVQTMSGRKLSCNLLMIVPPFSRPGASMKLGITDAGGYINVHTSMRVAGLERIYAAGDCVSFHGPKLGHMAVHQAEVAAENLAAEIEGHEPKSIYDHELMMVIDEGGADTIFLHKGLWDDNSFTVKQGRFWGWAKRVHEKYWEYRYS